jgi:hypothetical protein
VRLARPIGWLAVAALVVLSARTLSYALAPPTVLGGRLEAAAGGPRFLTVALVALALAAGVAASALGLATFAVRERLLLAPEPVVALPKLRPLRLVGRFVVLAVGTSIAFALLESYLHWRAGLGWHGLRCLYGPVHRDAVPLLAALSAVAVAIVAAVERVAAWIRRTIARLRSRAPRPRALVYAPGSTAPAHVRWPAGALSARGPPQLVVSGVST